MTLEELRDRIKNEVVLYEGELADWQWRQKGLVAEANELGINDFTRLVNDISRQVNRDFGKILDLKKKIITVALQRQKQLTEADINQFVAEAERVQLSRAFVTEQWIPAILEVLPAASAPELKLSSGGNASDLVTPEKKTPNPLSPESAPVTEKVESVRKKIKSILDDYDKHIQAQSLNFLFKAVDYDEAELAEEIRRYLSEHYYASVNPPRGHTLREKLISTDWRHLSWWEKEQAKSNPEPVGGYSKTRTDYNIPPVIGGTDASNRPPAAPWPQPPKPPQVPPSEPPKKGGLSDAAIIGLSVLTVIFLVWIVMRLVRVNTPDPLPKKPAKELNESPPGSEKSRIKPSKSQRPKKNPDASKEKASLRAANYDEIDDRAGEFGLRPARQGERWGYIDELNKWTIKPQFDLATPFNSGKASVEMDGIQFFIDRYGARIRGDN